MSAIVFSNVSARPELHDMVARWFWDFWGNPRNFEYYRSLVAHSREDDIPMVFIASVDGVPAGAVALLRADLFSRQDLFPWMADLYVLPEFRSKGVGSALQDMIIGKARELGYREIYLYTPLSGYYERKGWEYLGDEMDRDGEMVRIYKKCI
jgi:GNAT superfamily N-acetyltransferase